MTKQELVVQLGQMIEFLGWAEKKAEKIDAAFNIESSKMTAMIRQAIGHGYAAMNEATKVGEGPY